MNLIKTSKDRFLAIDANAIVHRAFHAYPSSLQTEDGLQVNAVYGFTVMLLSALKTFDPKYVLCCFDTHAPTFRHEEYPEYKGTRKATDQSLIDQFPLVEEVLKAFNIPILKKEGFEADDLLGTIAKYVSQGKWSEKNLELYILSGDRDLLQLVNDGVKVCLPAGNFKNLVEYDREGTYKYLGLYPEQVVDFKAIAGDASDNIPGIKGVGGKTVLGLLEKYGDMDTIYKNLGEIKPRYAKLLLEGIEQAELSRRLAKIEQEVGVQARLEDALLRDFEKERVVEVFKNLGFKSLVPRLGEIEGNVSGEESSQLGIFSAEPENIVWGGEEELNEYMKNCVKLYIAYIDAGESSIKEAFSVVRFVDKEGEKVDICTKENSYTTSLGCETVVYGYESLVSQVVGTNVQMTHDIGLLAHVINSEKKDYKLRDLAFDYSKQTIGESISPSEFKKVLDALEEIEISQKKRADGIELYEYTKKSLKKVLGIEENFFLNVMKKIELPIADILSEMENRGIAVDIDVLKKLDQELFSEIAKISKEIYETVGHEFNINSPKQLGDILFSELHLPSNRKVSTKESVLKELVGMHPSVEKILEYRELSKLYSTYTKPLLEMAKSREEPSIHTDFRQTGTTSGRFSSNNPNMQNIPLQGEWAEKLRKCFVARKGFKLLGMDYSQVELRIMADLSKDDLLIKDFNDGVDIHTATASRLLKKDIDEITKKERSIGKTVNFGILFGQTAYGLASMMKIDSEVAAEYIQSYFDHYKGVEEYIRNLEKEAYKRGYVQSMFGTTRWIRGLSSKNIRMRKAAQREAVNMPIQGSEADIMKLAMIKLADLIGKKYEGEAFILLQIHDELIFEVREERVKDFAKEAEEIMEQVVSLEVPLLVHSSVGDDMSELK